MHFRGQLPRAAQPPRIEAKLRTLMDIQMCPGLPHTGGGARPHSKKSKKCVLVFSVGEEAGCPQQDEVTHQ